MIFNVRYLSKGFCVTKIYFHADNGLSLQSGNAEKQKKHKQILANLLYKCVIIGKSDHFFYCCSGNINI